MKISSIILIASLVQLASSAGAAVTVVITSFTDVTADSFTVNYTATADADGSLLPPSTTFNSTGGTTINLAGGGDWMTATNGINYPLSTVVSGLTPNTTYDVTAYVYEWNSAAYFGSETDSITTVPEPSTIALGMGLIASIMVLRKRRSTLKK